jgi:hypothetical protein
MPLRPRQANAAGSERRGLNAAAALSLLPQSDAVVQSRLLVAIVRNKVNEVKEALRSGVSPDLHGRCLGFPQPVSPMALAIHCGHPKIMIELLKAGANGDRVMHASSGIHLVWQSIEQDLEEGSTDRADKVNYTARLALLSRLMVVEALSLSEVWLITCMILRKPKCVFALLAGGVEASPLVFWVSRSLALRALLACSQHPRDAT